MLGSAASVRRLGCTSDPSDLGNRNGLGTVLFVRPFYFAVTKLVPGLGFRHVDLSSPKVIVIGGLYALCGACLLIGGAIAATRGSAADTPRTRHEHHSPTSTERAVRPGP